MLVGVTGYAQHGKDTIGQICVRGGATRFAFADQLKELALYVNPIVIPADITGRATERRLRDVVDAFGWENAKKNAEVRRFLQELGTGVRDIIGEDAWVNALEKLWVASGAMHAVVTDVRFPNEADWIHRNNGVLLRVTRYVAAESGDDPWSMFDNGLGTDHPSEMYVPDLPADFDIENSGPIDQLEGRVMRALNNWSVRR